MDSRAVPAPARSTRIDPRLLVVAAAMLWGTTGTARALGPDRASPSAVGAARLIVGGACLAALAARRGWFGGCPPVAAGDAARRPAVGPWRLRVAVLVAGGAMAAYQPLFFGGVARTGVAVGTMVGIGSAPVFAGVLGSVVRDERPDRRWLGATGLAVAGTLLLVGAGARDDIDPTGLALALGAGASYAVYVAGSKVLLDAGRPPDRVVAEVFGLAAVALVPVAAAAGVGPLVSWGGAATIGHLGLVTVVVAYLLFGRGLAGIEVGTAGTLTLAEPATAAILGIVVLGERPALPTAGGLMLVAAGLALLVAGARRPAAPDVPEVR